jgi:2-iminobutanoate/2-iminopropanoate deaminase
MKKRVISPDVPEPAHGGYSNCLVAGNTIYLSGMHADIAGDKVLGDASFAGQMRASLRKLKALVEAAGGTMADIVKITIYITNLADRPQIAAIRREFFSGDFPCSTLITITALAAPELAIEIDAIAYVEGA